jgi:hypothetical protein
MQYQPRVPTIQLTTTDIVLVAVATARRERTRTAPVSAFVDPPGASAVGICRNHRRTDRARMAALLLEDRLRLREGFR